MTAKHMTVLVTGAGGHQGGAVARCLLAEGFPVRAFVHHRDQAQVRELRGEGAEIWEGDFEDTRSLLDAMAGVDVVFSVQDFHSAGFDGEVRQGRFVADAAAERGVSHFIYSSAGGADEETEIPHLESKREIEEYVRQSGLTHTILRPVSFYYNYLHPKVREELEQGFLALPLSPETRLQQVCEHDYARAVVHVIRNRERFRGKEWEIAGVELSLTETASQIGQGLGRTIRFLPVDLEQYQERAGEDLARMFRWFETRGYHADPETLRSAIGNITPLSDYIRGAGSLLKAA